MSKREGLEDRRAGGARWAPCSSNIPEGLVALAVAALFLLPPVPVGAASGPVQATSSPAGAALTTPPEALSARPRVGLVLSGGGARGGAHVGVLKVLEELRVPIDLVVGTSAGSIVGAAYASGLPISEIERVMSSVTTAALFRDTVRTDIRLHRRAETAGVNLIGPELGIGAQGVELPKGAVAGVTLGGVLRDLTRLQDSKDFDELPIPFRAVATDIVTAEMVVLDKGNLAEAVRASMAIPAALSPVTIDGRLLVDGGASRNLPVDVARALGAEVVIAVNIGTPLLEQDELSSLLAMSTQILRILTATNVRRSIAELGPRDILITPDLGRMSITDFDHLMVAEQAGESAARSAAGQLRVLSLDEAQYREWKLARSPVSRSADSVLAEVRVSGTERSNADAIEAVMRTREQGLFDQAQANEDMRRIYGLGDFESSNFHLSEGPLGQQVMEVDVNEKAWGPHYLRLGLGLSSDFEGNAYFQLLAAHRSTWLNSLGGEWRNTLKLGHSDLLRTEWHQPLTRSQRLFAEARFELERTPFDIYEDSRMLARYRRESYGLGLDFGVSLDTDVELRLGLRRGRVKLADDTGEVPGSYLMPESDTAAAVAHLRFDTLDNLHFPRRGHAGGIQYLVSRRGLGATDDYNRLAAAYTKALAHGPHSLQLSAKLAKLTGTSTPPVYELFSLGGFLNLSGFRTSELLGHEVAFGRALYNYRLSGPALLDGSYFGLSLEAGRIGDSISGPHHAGTQRGASVYFAVDTPLGPLYLAYGRGSGSRSAFYLFLGQP